LQASQPFFYFVRPPNTAAVIKQIPDFYLFFEFASFFIALANYRYLKGSYLVYTIPFLGVVCLGESIAYYQTHFQRQTSTIINYVIGIFETVFYGYFYYNLNSAQRLKKISFWFVPTSFVIYFIFISTFKTELIYMFYSISLNGLLISVLALSYLYYLFTHDYQTSLFRKPGFWISFGASMFYSGTSIAFAFASTVQKTPLRIFGHTLVAIVTWVLCAVLYTSFGIAVVVHRKNVVLGTVDRSCGNTGIQPRVSI
jgi:hypothetical protein